MVADQFHCLQGRPACGPNIFDDDAPLAGIDLEPSPKGQVTLLSFRKDAPKVHRPCNFVSYQNSTECRRYHTFYPIGNSEKPFRQRLTEGTGRNGMLQHQGALEIAIGVQARGQQKVSLQQGVGATEQVQNVFRSHGKPFVCAVKYRSKSGVFAFAMVYNCAFLNKCRRVFMSGHSKWHSIKHKKAATDAKRGRMYTRLIKEMTVAARMGGGDVESNPRLRLAVNSAKSANMPAENIKRAIMRGTGELPGILYEEVNYEGYGPGGVALYLRVLTDNKNRTVAEIRHILSKYHGNLGENGCVAWMFSKKGYFVVERSVVDEDTLLEIILGSGGEDMREDGNNYEIFSAPEKYDEVKAAFDEANITVTVSEVSMIPQNYVKLEGKDAQTLIKLLEALEDHEDIQNVWANFDIDASELKEAS